MFAVNIKRVYSVCDKVIVRTLRVRRLGPNPGLDKRSQVFQKEGIKLDDNDAEEFVEESEGNFMGSGNVYEEHTRESKINKEKLRQLIVQQKYFKENLPNLLTWSEKEQIRHLNTEDPDEWTPDKIAESFPVTAAVVKKLLKYSWKPATQERIDRHDASAMRNWRELKEGTLDIPPELREHFLQFSERTIPPLDKKSIVVDLTPSESIGEFQAIIDRCAAKEKSNDTQDDTEQNFNDDKLNTENKYNKRITLEELTNRIKLRMESGDEVNIPDQIMITNTAVNNVDQVGDKGNEFNNQIESYKEHDKVTVFKAEDNIVQIKEYPQRIRISKKAYKKGVTYKVDDCYYDEDGRFLYRVIGMN